MCSPSTEARRTGARGRRLKPRPAVVVVERRDDPRVMTPMRSYPVLQPPARVIDRGGAERARPDGRGGRWRSCGSRRAGSASERCAGRIPHAALVAGAALDAGASLPDVQDAVGHADPATTRRYDGVQQSLGRHPRTLWPPRGGERGRRCCPQSDHRQRRCARWRTPRTWKDAGTALAARNAADLGRKKEPILYRSGGRRSGWHLSRVGATRCAAAVRVGASSPGALEFAGLGVSCEP